MAKTLPVDEKLGDCDGDCVDDAETEDVPEKDGVPDDVKDGVLLCDADTLEVPERLGVKEADCDAVKEGVSVKNWDGDTVVELDCVCEQESLAEEACDGELEVLPVEVWLDVVVDDEVLETEAL